jgi:hypothetical protein
MQESGYKLPLVYHLLESNESITLEQFTQSKSRIRPGPVGCEVLQTGQVKPGTGRIHITGMNIQNSRVM